MMLTTPTKAKKMILAGNAPDNLQVSGGLNLSGCTSLAALPDNLQVSGWLNLSGCTSLAAGSIKAARKKFSVIL